MSIAVFEAVPDDIPHGVPDQVFRRRDVRGRYGDTLTLVFADTQGTTEQTEAEVARLPARDRSGFGIGGECKWKRGGSRGGIVGEAGGQEEGPDI